MIQAPKGTKDVLPQNSYLLHFVEDKMRKAAALAGYREIRTPVFEHTELFQRGVGGTTDIVQKEMYTFLDKGKRSVTLKPEGTAGVVRALIENKLYAELLPQKVYYLNAPIFRYENPQSGRLREHHQFGMECFGAKDATVDAELIGTLVALLKDMGLENMVVHINSIGCPNCRPAYHAELLKFLRAHEGELCETCRERMERNPLRVLDCKVDSCKKVVRDAPVMLDHLCDDCRPHFETLKRLLELQGIDFAVDTHIVRGLDYYTKTVFEIIMQSGREGLALCGGGRYDGLVEQLDGPAMPAVGFGMGLERVLLELANQGVLPQEPGVSDVFVANVGAEDRDEAFALCQRLRRQGVRAESDHLSRSLKAQFKYANKMHIGTIVMVGGEERERGAVKVRNLNTGEEQEVAAADVLSYIQG